MCGRCACAGFGTSERGGVSFRFWQTLGLVLGLRPFGRWPVIHARLREVGTAATDVGLAPPSTGARASRRPISGSSRACRGIAMGRRTGRGATALATASSIAPRRFVPVAWTAMALMAPLAVGGADPEFTLAYPPPPPPGPTAPSYVPRWVTRSIRAIPRVVPTVRARIVPRAPRRARSDADEKCCPLLTSVHPPTSRPPQATSASAGAAAPRAPAASPAPPPPHRTRRRRRGLHRRRRRRRRRSRPPGASRSRRETRTAISASWTLGFNRRAPPTPSTAACDRTSFPRRSFRT